MDASPGFAKPRSEAVIVTDCSQKQAVGGKRDRVQRIMVKIQP
jgi:hypothetical protein